MMYMSSKKNPWPSTEAIGSKLIVVPCLSGPTGRPAIRFVVCTCQYGTFLRSDQESIVSGNLQNYIGLPLEVKIPHAGKYDPRWSGQRPSPSFAGPSRCLLPATFKHKFFGRFS